MTDVAPEVAGVLAHIWDQLGDDHRQTILDRLNPPAPPPPPGDPPPAGLYSADPGNGQPYTPWISVDAAGNLYVYGTLVTGGGLHNPMTTKGDTIYSADNSGTPARLGVGATGQVLTVAAGIPSWANASSGFANPMTTAGDLIDATTGGTPQRLPIGGNGQVLSVVSGAPAWANSPAGFTNPMTSTGDLIYSSSNSGTPARRGAGATGQVLTMAGGVPGWQTPATGTNLPFVVLKPSGDTSGVSDFNAFMMAVSALPDGGLIYMFPGDFYTNTQWTLPAQTTGTSSKLPNGGHPVCLQGAGASTTLYAVGNITTIYYHRTISYGSQFGQAADPSAGFIRDLVIDGTFATGAAVGLDVGDGRGWQIDVTVQNFATGGTAIGCNIYNRKFWTEKSWFKIQHYNNDTACVMGTSGTGDHSHEYNVYDFMLFANSDQQGIVVKDGLNQGGSQIYIKGNMALTSSSSGVPTGNVAMLTLKGNDGTGDASRWFFGQLWLKVEGNPGDGTGTTYPYGIYSDGQGYIRQCAGFISHSLTGSNMNNAECSFSGSIAGDNNLADLVPQQNTTASGSNGADISTIGAWSSPSAGVFAVASTTGFDSSGFITVALASGDSATISYSATTGTTFTGCAYISGSAANPGAHHTATGNLVQATTNNAQPNFPGYGVIMRNIAPDQVVSVYDAANVSGASINAQATGLPVGSFGSFFLRAGGSFTVTGSVSAPTVYSWAPASKMTY